MLKKLWFYPVCLVFLSSVAPLNSAIQSDVSKHPDKRVKIISSKAKLVDSTYIDRGRLKGVKVGDHYEVVNRKGKHVTEVVVTAVFDRMSAVKIVDSVLLRDGYRAHFEHSTDFGPFKAPESRKAPLLSKRKKAGKGQAAPASETPTAEAPAAVPEAPAAPGAVPEAPGVPAPPAPGAAAVPPAPGVTGAAPEAPGVPAPPAPGAAAVPPAPGVPGAAPEVPAPPAPGVANVPPAPGVPPAVPEVPGVPTPPAPGVAAAPPVPGAPDVPAPPAPPAPPAAPPAF